MSRCAEHRCDHQLFEQWFLSAKTQSLPVGCVTAIKTFLSQRPVAAHVVTIAEKKGMASIRSFVWLLLLVRFSVTGETETTPQQSNGNQTKEAVFFISCVKD